MNRFQYIESKLEGFIKKYYLNKLIKGGILFISIGTLYFIVSVAVEHLLYLSPASKTLLFYLFVLVEIILFIFFIILPIVKLLRLSKGISSSYAATLIGNHFPEVDDRLLNLLQLSDNRVKSDLLLASIDQKAKSLSPVPFKKAITFKSNVKYLKYIILPIILFLFFSALSGFDWFTSSYDRFVKYDTSFVPPAPFNYLIENDNLSVHENKDYVLRVQVVGSTIPEMLTIHFHNESYYMSKKSIDVFEFLFEKMSESKSFYIEANGVRSREYLLRVINVPNLIELKVYLEYPNYTGLKDEQMLNTGNFVVPEGTKIRYNIISNNTDAISFITEDSIKKFVKNNNTFTREQRVYNSFNYTITTSNTNVSNYDELAYKITSIQDEFPKITVQEHIDSLRTDTRYYYGKISDDYGLTKLRIVYQNIDRSTPEQYQNIKFDKGNFSEFVYDLVTSIEFESGKTYEYFFEVWDNDALHNYKNSVSKVFMYSQLSEQKKEEKRLENQKSILENLDATLNKFEDSENELQRLSRLQKEQTNMDYEDKQKLKDFLEKQKMQEQLMKKFSEKLQNNLSEETPEENKEPFKDALKEKLERQQARLKKNEELLKEIEKLAQDINREKLTEKLDQLAKENKNIKKNLEQLLELTKRFYVKEKHDKLADDLLRLAEKQEELAAGDKEKNTTQAQDSVSKNFDKIKEALDKLEKDNESLKKPMNLEFDKKAKEQISEEQEKATDNLKEEKQAEAKKNQQSAAQQMKNMAAKMHNQMQMSGEAQQEEDAEMLRQILDNLVDFSLSQETLLTEFSEISINNPSYSYKLKRQSVLRENFVHVDDSLYALALRTPEITDDVTDKLSDVEFNLDKSIERLAENQLIQGKASQQFTITGANDLAYLLSNVLEQMQNSIPSSGSGKGQGKGFQLPDIIKSQEELNDRMQKGSKGQSKDGKGTSEKESGEQGDEKSGNSDKEKSSGKEGEQGEKSGNSSQAGDGKKGPKGKGKNRKGEGGNESGEGEFGEEEMNGELFEIYKAQQELRKALEQKMNEAGVKDKGINVLKRMEGVENELLQRGFNEQTLQRMMDLKHQLLKLDKAAFEQGKKEERESKTNRQNYKGVNSLNKEQIKQYFKTTEILERQVLPLRQNYKEKVKTYFNKSND
ncbi:DUF4175 family protein [Aquimarina intermedia]|uniref:DUF4175 family protein n=1 Tax=Aquimarina intermedia TaxID=350814 RepID=A0A5S5CFW7_9FLAO|nr:DUF4175 family protein [Aquimarina intermedia]TYP76903.1 hypothetical protein BD809_10148 [Aquimarina intermedia]